MPFGRNITTATSSRPIQKYQYCGLMPENWSRATMKMIAPIEAAVEPAGAAEDQDHQHVGRALEAERLERHGLGGLRQQRAGDAGDHGARWCRSCGGARGSARRCAGMRAEFSRMPRSDRPNGELIMRRVDQEHEEQHDQRIGVGGVAVEIEAEGAEERPDLHALQAVGAAGEPARAVGRLVQQQAQAERDHDQREMAEARRR